MFATVAKPKRSLVVTLALSGIALVFLGVFFGTGAFGRGPRVLWLDDLLVRPIREWVGIWASADETIFAAGFSEPTFRALDLGASMDEARKHLGEPLSHSTASNGRIIWHYSAPAKPSSSYLVRTLQFDAGGKLIRKGSDYYLD